VAALCNSDTLSNPNAVVVAPLAADKDPVAQAMVWIMSDNTDYAALGELVSGLFPEMYVQRFLLPFCSDFIHALHSPR
jgi:hypothetical protein